MKLESPRTIAADLATAYRAALDGDEPVFVPASIYTDDRGWSIMNQFQGVLSAEGQVNYSVMYPGVIKAWHRHQLQTDFWMCVQGHIKVGVHRQDGRTWSVVTGEKKPGIVIIPPNLWHGTATVGHEPAGMFYYVTVGYNGKQPDEERRGWDSVEDFPWAVQHR